MTTYDEEEAVAGEDPREFLSLSTAAVGHAVEAMNDTVAARYWAQQIGVTLDELRRMPLSEVAGLHCGPWGTREIPAYVLRAVSPVE